jgi:hypothetical protein
MRSEPVFGETYSGLIDALDDVALGTAMVNVAVLCELFIPFCVLGTEPPPPPHPASAKSAIRVALRRIR